MDTPKGNYDAKALEQCEQHDKKIDLSTTIADDKITFVMEKRTLDDTKHVNEQRGHHSELDDESNLPKDTGWSWFVMLGTLLEMMLVIGILKAGGIIFVAFQERFNSTSSLTSLLSTLQNAVYSISAPIVLCIGKRVTSARVLVSIGTLIVVVAYIITSQATDIRILFFSHGILQGLSTAFMLPITTVTLANYFDKKRGFANSLSLSGGSLGGLILAPLLTYLLKEYGYQGCFLIVAGILLNGLVCGALFRPYSYYRVKPKTRTPLYKGLHELEGKSLIPQPSKTSNGLPDGTIANSFIKTNVDDMYLDKQYMGSKQSLTINNNCDIYIEQTDAKNGQLVETQLRQSQKDLNLSREFMRGSMYDINTEHLKEQTVDEENINTINHETDRKMTVKTMLKLLISSFDVKLFRNPIFCILQLSGFLICGNMVLFPVYIAPHARDMGEKANGIALLVTMLSSTDFISRVVIALIADRGWIRRSNISAISILCVAVASNFLRFYETFNTLMVYGVILGLFSGVYFSLFPVLIVDYLTIQKLPATLGFISLFHGASVSIFYYVIGYLRDVTGSYIVPFHLMGCLCIVGSALHFSLPFVERYQKRKESRAV